MQSKIYRYCLTEEQVSQYKSIFDKWVVRSNRKLGHRCTIQKSQLNSFLKHLGFSFSELELQELLLKLNIDRCWICFSQIIRLIGRRSIEEDLEEEVKRIFQFFDSDNDGKLNARQLKKGLISLHHKVTAEDIDRIILDNDLDGDGYLNYEEFLVLILCK